VPDKRAFTVYEIPKLVLPTMSYVKFVVDINGGFDEESHRNFTNLNL
jgi:hypothetical protein